MLVGFYPASLPGLTRQSIFLRRRWTTRSRVFPSSGTLDGRKSETSDLRWSKPEGRLFRDHALGNLSHHLILSLLLLVASPQRRSRHGRAFWLWPLWRAKARIIPYSPGASPRQIKWVCRARSPNFSAAVRVRGAVCAPCREQHDGRVRAGVMSHRRSPERRTRGSNRNDVGAECKIKSHAGKTGEAGRVPAKGGALSCPRRTALASERQDRHVGDGCNLGDFGAELRLQRPFQRFSLGGEAAE